MESLKEKLKSGDKSLVGNKGYRRYLKSAGKEHFTVDEAKLAKEQLFDGMWVLRTLWPCPSLEHSDLCRPPSFALFAPLDKVDAIVMDAVRGDDRKRLEENGIEVSAAE